MKYILLKATIYDDREESYYYGFTFPDLVIHKEMAHDMRRRVVRDLQNFKNVPVDAQVVSAGFVYLPSFETYGESESLGIKSRKEDGEILKNCGTGWYKVPEEKKDDTSRGKRT